MRVRAMARPMNEPFFELIAYLTRAGHALSRGKSSTREQEVNMTQLDLFRDEDVRDEDESLADRIGDLIVRDFIVSMHEAGANLATLKIQVAINAARERTIDTLKSAFRTMRRNAAETQ
jgi:hypothetical protein